MFLRYAQYALTGGAQLIVTGAGVLFVLLVLPGGLAQVTAGLRRRTFALVARRRRHRTARRRRGEPAPTARPDLADPARRDRRRKLVGA